MNTIKRKYEKHGNSKHRLYTIWLHQKKRCDCPTNKAYKYYGERGIRVSPKFDSFLYWLNIIENLPNAYKDGYSIDRINNNGNYEEGNLRWATHNTQSQNTRRIRRTNTSGYRGVSFKKTTQRWRAQICIKRKVLHLGYYDTKIQAAQSYDNYIISHNLEHTKNFKEKKCQCI